MNDCEKEPNRYYGNRVYTPQKKTLKVGLKEQNKHNQRAN